MTERLDGCVALVTGASRGIGAAVAVDGKMVDKPVLLRAEALLREAGAG